MTTSTRYQKTHRPTSRVQILCASRSPLVNGFCPDCGRFLERGGRDHKPNREGAFGWVERYGDGSTKVVPGVHEMPWCKVCEQRNVPAIHRTPLGETCYGPVFPTPRGGR